VVGEAYHERVKTGHLVDNDDARARALFEDAPCPTAIVKFKFVIRRKNFSFGHADPRSNALEMIAIRSRPVKKDVTCRVPFSYYDPTKIAWSWPMPRILGATQLGVSLVAMMLLTSGAGADALDKAVPAPLTDEMHTA